MWHISNGHFAFITIIQWWLYSEQRPECLNLDVEKWFSRKKKRKTSTRWQWKVLKNENRSTDQPTALIHPDNISSFHSDILELTHSHTSVYLFMSLWYSMTMAAVYDSTAKPSCDSADLSSFQKRWRCRSDRNTSKVVCRVQPLFRNAWVISSKNLHVKILTLKLFQENFERKQKVVANTNAFQRWAQDNRLLHQDAFTST